MGPTFAGADAAPAVDEAAASTIKSGGRVLSLSSGGATVALAVGGAVASTVDTGGAPTVPAVGGVTEGLRGCALETLASEGGVGRERVPAAPGSIVFQICVGNTAKFLSQAGLARVFGHWGTCGARWQTGSSSAEKSRTYSTKTK